MNGIDHGKRARELRAEAKMLSEKAEESKANAAEHEKYKAMAKDASEKAKKEQDLADAEGEKEGGSKKALYAVGAAFAVILALVALVYFVDKPKLPMQMSERAGGVDSVKYADVVQENLRLKSENARLKSTPPQQEALPPASITATVATTGEGNIKSVEDKMLKTTPASAAACNCCCEKPKPKVIYRDRPAPKARVITREHPTRVISPQPPAPLPQVTLSRAGLRNCMARSNGSLYHVATKKRAPEHALIDEKPVWEIDPSVTTSTPPARIREVCDSWATKAFEAKGYRLDYLGPPREQPR